LPWINVPGQDCYFISHNFYTNSKYGLKISRDKFKGWGGALKEEIQ
jgi:hypothetical protein